MRNGPNTDRILDLPLLSEVITYREKGDNGKPGWSGPFKLIGREGHNCVVETPNGPTTLRSTSVKPYYADEAIPSEKPMEDTDDIIVVEMPDDCQPPETVSRPKPTVTDDGEVRKPTVTDRNLQNDSEYRPTVVRKPPTEIRRSGRTRKTPHHLDQDSVFMTHKEQSDFDLAIKLRAEGKIKTSGDPFEASIKEELKALRASGVFKIVKFDPCKHGNIRIFNSRFVNEIKGKTTIPYEKSRLVIQAYSDDGKAVILTQSPTIQRSSQRLLIIITPSLIAILEMQIRLSLRDIT